MRARSSGEDGSVTVHLIDGTYELFRHFYGLHRAPSGTRAPRIQRFLMQFSWGEGSLTARKP
jgi:hypothetical protein